MFTTGILRHNTLVIPASKSFRPAYRRVVDFLASRMAPRFPRPLFSVGRQSLSNIDLFNSFLYALIYVIVAMIIAFSRHYASGRAGARMRLFRHYAYASMHYSRRRRHGLAISFSDALRALRVGQISRFRRLRLALKYY